MTSRSSGAPPVQTTSVSTVTKMRGRADCEIPRSHTKRPVFWIFLMLKRIESPRPNSGGDRELRGNEVIAMLLDVALE